MAVVGSPVSTEGWRGCHPSDEMLPEFGHLSVVMAPPPVPNMVFLAPSCPIVVLVGEPRVTRIDRLTSPARKNIEGQLGLILDNGKWGWWEVDLETFHSFLAALWDFQKRRDRRREC